MDEIAELQRVADAEDGRVVSCHIPITLFGIEFQRKPARVARRVRRALLSANGGEAQERRRLLAHSAKEFCRRVLGDFGAGANEMAVCTRALGVHYALWDSLAVELCHLFEEQKVFEDYRAARPQRQRIPIVANGTARVRRHDFLFFFWHGSSSV